MSFQMYDGLGGSGVTGAEFDSDCVRRQPASKFSAQARLRREFHP